MDGAAAGRSRHNDKMFQLQAAQLAQNNTDNNPFLNYASNIDNHTWVFGHWQTLFMIIMNWFANRMPNWASSPAIIILLFWGESARNTWMSCIMAGGVYGAFLVQADTLVMAYIPAPAMPWMSMWIHALSILTDPNGWTNDEVYERKVDG